MQVAQRGQDLEHVGDGLGDRKLLSPNGFQRFTTDIFHDDVADWLAPGIRVFDEVEDLHDRWVRYFGEELPFRHRDGLCLGIAGMHQTLEHHRSLVDVVVNSQVHPAQSAVRDATLDLVLFGDHIGRVQLWQERIGAAAARAETFGLAVAGLGRAADRTIAVPAESFRLGDNGIHHQRGERIDLRYPRYLDESTTEPTRQRQCPGHGGLVLLGGDRLAADRGLIVGEVRPEDRLGGHRSHGRHRIHPEFLDIGRPRADVTVG